MEDTGFKTLDAEIAKSRKDIIDIQERVKALTERRRQREAMVKKVQDSVVPSEKTVE